jgi:transposase
MAIIIRDAARDSIGSVMPAKSMELKHTIHLIEVMTDEIDEIESSIESIMDTSGSPIMTIPGINYRMGAMILAEVGDFSRFSNADQILAFAGLSPSTYQSGQLDSSYSYMEKRGSRYLRYALFNATKYVCHWDEKFGKYLAKKIGEGKHYNVAVSHAAKKLIRTIYRMELTGEAYRK